MEAFWTQVFLPLAGCALTILLLWATFRAERRRRLAVDLPISSTRGVFIGMVALAGTAESTFPLTSRVAPEIVADEAQELFLISVRSTRGIVWGYAAASVGYAIAALLTAAGTVRLAAAARDVARPFVDTLLQVGPIVARVVSASPRATAS
jgi:hypothetical protein